MQDRSFFDLIWSQQTVITEATVRRGRGADAQRNWLSEPKSAVWMVLAAAVVFGGGRKLAQSYAARKAVARLEDDDVTDAEIEAVAEHGRSGVGELLRIFSTAATDARRSTAGRSLARLWMLDQLVAEEEQAIVRRGYTVNWSARRRYPRNLAAEIPIVVTYGIPFLSDDGRRVGPSNLEWSHRILGARRAVLEEFSDWTPGEGRVAFSIFPGDFDSNGPHRLVLSARVRTAGLTDTWAIDLPQVPFQFEFDPLMRLDSILTLPDATRDEVVKGAIQLERGQSDESAPGRYLSLGEEFTIRNPPRLAIGTPLPADLAHAIYLELDGVPGRLSCGKVILSGQGGRLSGGDGPGEIRRFDLGPIAPLPRQTLERPGVRRARLAMECGVELGWADPDIRSLWPGRAETNWVDVEIVRR
jgi:hypothetical protein